MFDNRQSSLVNTYSFEYLPVLLGREVVLSLTGLNSLVDLNCLRTSLLIFSLFLPIEF